MAFPTTLDTFVNPSGSSTTDNPSLSAAVTNAGNGLETLMIKVGIDSSAVTTSHDYKLSNVTGSDKAASVTGTETLTGKTLFTPVIDAGIVLNSLDMDGKELILDGDADTSIHADTDDQIDIRIAANDDFKFTANLFTALDGSDILVSNNDSYQVDDSGGTARNAVKATTTDILDVGDSSLKGVMFQNGCFLHEAGFQDIVNNTATDLLFDAAAEIYDPLAMHNTSTNTDRIVVPVTGIYEVIASGHWEDDTTNTVRILDIKVDGTSVASNRSAVDTGGRGANIAYYVGSISAASFVEIGVNHLAGANLEFRDYSFSVKLVGI